MILDGKSSQEYPVNAGVPEGSILGTTLFLLYINDISDDVICRIATYADDTTVNSKCDHVDSGKKCLVDFNARKTQLVSFDRPNNTGSIDVKMDESFLEEKCLG